MSDIYFEDLPSTATPLRAINLNKLNDVKVSSTAPTTGEKVWVKHKDNLFDIDNAIITNAYFNSDTGEMISGGSSYVTENYTEVEANKSYNVTGATLRRTVFYKTKKKILSVSTTSTYFTTPDNTKYIRIQIDSNTSNLIIQEGTNYIKDDIYILNKNKVYELLHL